jgi:HK97 family phage major capsid protein
MMDEKVDNTIETLTEEIASEFLEKHGYKIAQPEDPIKALQGQMDSILEMLSKNGPLKDAGYIAPDSETDHEESKSFGDFLVAVRLGNARRLKSVYKTVSSKDLDARDGYKAALAEGSGATGGYLVPVEYGGMLMAKVGQLSILRQAGATVVPMASRSREIPMLDVETAPAAGNTAFAGGAIAYWISEAGSITESEPSFRLAELVAHKLAAFSLASNEVRDDAAESVDGILGTSFSRALAAQENYQFFRGTLAGRPRGIVASSALISATRSAASTVALADIAQMMSDFLPESWSTGAWFISPTVIDQLIQLVSNPLSWLDDVKSGLPMRLLGLPVYVSGALPALNTAGDILLVDPSYYLIGDRQTMEIAYSEHFKFQNDQGAWRAISRVDGMPWVDNSITLEDGSTTVSPFVALAAG